MAVHSLYREIVQMDRRPSPTQNEKAHPQGTDLELSLDAIAVRAKTLLRGSGVAIALATSDPTIMVCYGSAGVSAPPSRAELQVSSGFSGECVHRKTVLRCDDTDTGECEDRERYRALGIRSMIAAPVKAGHDVVGIIEVFSSKAGTFHKNDGVILLQLAEVILSSLNRAASDQNQSVSMVLATPDSSLHPKAEDKNLARRSRGRGRLLGGASAALLLAFGYTSASRIQQRAHVWRSNIQAAIVHSQSTTQPQPMHPVSSSVSVQNDFDNFEQLRQLADHGDSPAQYALGVRYAVGDGVVQDYTEAFRWFSLAANQGNPSSQAMLGTYYMVGRGVSVDLSKAYFWDYLAGVGGDTRSKLRAERLCPQIPSSRIAELRQAAHKWLHEHPQPGAE